jgi:hypothetical protein
MLLQSTARTIAPARSLANMLFTASAAIQVCVLNTAMNLIGRSKTCRQRARVLAWLTLQAGARWGTAPRAYGLFGMEKGLTSNRACRWRLEAKRSCRRAAAACARSHMHATQLRLTLALAFRRVTLFASAQGAAYAAAEARSVADGNARTGPVFISGATCTNAASINGFYVVANAKSFDGRLVLSKRGDPGMCIEHRGGQWEVKTWSSKGTGACMAYVAGGCALVDCTSRVWVVWNGKGFDEQPSVQMATGSEAELQVSGGCMRALAHARDTAAPHPRARVSPCDAVRFCTGRGVCGG